MHDMAVIAAAERLSCIRAYGDAGGAAQRARGSTRQRST
jgi:hypothetical protein